MSLALTIGACGDKKMKKSADDSHETAALSGTIKVDGSSTVFPITEAVAEEFRSVQPEVKVTVGVSGTGGGFKKFSRGETNLSNASRPIKDKEKAACEENNIKYLELEVAYDGLAVIVHPENYWVDHFTVEELKKIWEPTAQGKIMRWNQVRPEWPNEEMHLFALGFFGLAYYSENKDRLKLIGVDNGKEVVKPSLETVKNGSYKPLSRPLFIYVNSTSVASPEVVEFVNFYIDNAGELSQDVGYIPLPADNYNAQKESFRTFVESNK